MFFLHLNLEILRNKKKIKLKNMNKYIKLFAVILIASFSLAACQNSGGNNAGGGKVSPTEFKKMIEEDKNAQIVDVRTPEEYAEGHVKGAQNMDINSNAFEEGVKGLDKNKTVYVYCLSGGRSSSAVSYLKEQGFKTIYEMPGIMKWRAEGLELEAGAGAEKSADTGLTMEAFKKLVSDKEYVLVDYNAVWCKPCKQLAPIVEKISVDKADKLKLLKVDADENATLLQSMGIDAIPVLQLYHNGEKVWEHKGLIDEKTILAETKL